MLDWASLNFCDLSHVSRPLGAIDHGLADQLDITWGDPDAWTAEGLHWTHLPQVRAAINRKVSGAAEVSPLRWFFRRWPPSSCRP